MSPDSHGWRPRCFRIRAFTLIELLVVLAIIGVLAALLLPLLSRARKSALNVVCVNNLHQLTVAMGAYMSDALGQTPGIASWLTTNVSFASVQRDDITSGALYPYVRNRAVYQCPSDTALKKVPVEITPRDYSYAMNCVVCHAAQPASCHWASRTLMLLEADLPLNYYNGLIGPPENGNAILDASFGMAYSHQNRGHLAMLDLHVESLAPRQFGGISNQVKFWFPTEDTTGPGAIELVGSLVRTP